MVDGSSLSAEIDRLIPLLAKVDDHPWPARVAALKRVCTLTRDHTARAQVEFAPSMVRLQSGICEQLRDRRSLVVKQACETILAIAAQCKESYTNREAAAHLTDEQFDAAQAAWIHITTTFIEHTLPSIPITVKVISESACQCLNGLVEHISPLYRAGQFDYPILSYLLGVCTTQKHGIVREHCFSAIANSLLRLDQRYIERETNQDANEVARINERQTDEPDEESVSIASSSTAAPPASSSSSPDTDSSSSLLFSQLESRIAAGINDSFDKARDAARLALIHFERISPARSARITLRMTQAQQNKFTDQKSEYLMNEVVQLTATADINDKSTSNEKEIKPNNKSTSANNANKKTTTANGPTGKSKFNKSNKKKIAKSGDGDVVVVSGRIGAAESAEKKKEADAAAVLAAAQKAKADLTDEADEESTTVTAAKPNKSTASDADDDDSDADGADKVTTGAPSSALSSPSAATLYARNFTLLSKLLDLETPMLTDKMIDFLLHEGVADVFISFIARVKYDEVDIEQLQHVKSFADLGAKYQNVFDPHTAIDPTDAPRTEFSEVPLVHRSRPEPDNADEHTAVRRSYHVMQIFCGQRQSNSLMAVLTTKIPQIVLKLMCVFHPKSKGNFYHACSVLVKLIGTFPGTVLTALNSPSGRTLVSLMFDHLHEPPVIPAIIAFVQASINNKVLGSTVPSDLVLHIKQLNILHGKLIPRIIGSPTSSRIVSQASTDFIIQYLEKIQQCTTEKGGVNMTRLFDDIGQDGRAVDQLISALVDPHSQRPTWQTANIGVILQTLLQLSSDEQLTIVDSDPKAQALAQMTGNTAALQKKVTNPLFILKADIQRSMSHKIIGLCNTLTRGERLPVDESAAASTAAAATAAPTAAIPSSLTSFPPIQFSSYHVPSAFSSARVQLFKLICKLIQNDIDLAMSEVADAHAKKLKNPSVDLPQSVPAMISAVSPRLFAQIPHHTWHVLIEWFFQYRHNNFFLGGFRKLILSILKLTVEASRVREECRKADPTSVPTSIGCASDEVLRYLLLDARMLNRMITFYTSSSSPSCAGSYILELSNHFRLSADLLPHSSFIWSYLASNQAWLQFQEKLLSESRKQARNLHIRPFEEDPASAERAALERALGFSLGGSDEPPANPDAFIIPDGYVEGVELGSVFAWHLGYKDKAPAVEKQKPKTGKQKVNTTDNNNNIHHVKLVSQRAAY